MAPEELELTAILVDGLATPEFDLGEYHDEYTAKLSRLIEAKVAGQELVTPPPAPEPQVINLMDALKKSVASLQKPARRRASKTSAPAKRPRSARKRAPAPSGRPAGAECS